jgi:ATP-binding cassette subfamily F protein 3
MLQVHQISKSYGIHTILEKVTFSILPDDRVGLVGENGCGKSTLLRIIVQEEEPDKGTISMTLPDSLGYLPQGFDLALADTVGDFIRSGIPGLGKTQAQIAALNVQMEHDHSIQTLQTYGEVLSRYEALDGYARESEATAILDHLGLQNVSQAARMNELSSGQRTRVGLARLLIARPAILLLDEPTNHLDIDALEWLEGFLSGYRGAVLVVSHDRRFLDQTVHRILELDIEKHTLHEYPGGYSDYAESKAREVEKQWGAWKDQKAEIHRLEQDIRQTKEHALATERSTNNDHQRRIAKKVAQRAKSKEKRLQRYLEGEKRVERPTASEKMRLKFAPKLRSGQVVISLTDIAKSYGGPCLFSDVEQTLKYGERVALVGPNGSGKTTLLRMIMGEVPVSRGEIIVGPSVRIGYMPQQQEVLDPGKSALDTIQNLVPMSESEIYNFLHYFLIYDDKVRQPTGQLSYGERARLLLARLVVSGANCLLLDEPINHLDIPSRQQFETALEGFPGSVLVSVHDRTFIEQFATSIWRIKNGRLNKEYLKDL